MKDLKNDMVKRDVRKGGLLVVEDNNYVRLKDDTPYDVKRFLDVYREQPSLVRQKVQELENLGFLLPFSQRGVDTVSTGIDGLDNILNPYQRKTNAVSGFKQNRNILIVGGPGTGKTTLLLQILHWNVFQDRRNVLMLTFEEQFPVVTKSFAENFGWEVNFVESIAPLKQKSSEKILEDIHARIENKQADLVAIDGLSRLRSLFKEDFRDLIDNFFKALQIKGITGIFTIEEPIGTDPREEYQADAVLHLYRRGEKREFEIKKLRSQNFIAGCHAFEIIDQFYLTSHCRLLPSRNEDYFPFQTGINVYPNEQYYASVTNLTMLN